MKRRTNRILPVFCLFVLFVSCAFAQTVRHVWTNSPFPGTPFNAWTNAARDIQAAIDAAEAGDGDWVWVTNGVYGTGGRPHTAAALTNRVCIDKAMRVESVNGPSNTIIVGRWHNPGGAPANSNYFGPNAVRCVYMTNNARLEGFTIRAGATFNIANFTNGSGGGVWGEADASVSNCVISENNARYAGGGAYRGGFYNCIVEKNYCASSLGGGGGARSASLYNCSVIGNTAEYGGGGNYCTFYNCILGGNSGVWGGAANGSTLYNCLMAGNVASQHGGGMRMGSHYNCTITGNTANQGGGVAYPVEMFNSICFHNMAATSSNCYDGVFSFTCAAPLQAGNGNIDENPMFEVPGSGYGASFVFGDYRLALGSPCVNAGTNFAYMTDLEDPHGRNRDLDGKPRLRGPAVDMGAYEQYIAPGTIFIIRGGP